MPTFKSNAGCIRINDNMMKIYNYIKKGFNTDQHILKHMRVDANYLRTRNINDLLGKLIKAGLIYNDVGYYKIIYNGDVNIGDVFKNGVLMKNIHIGNPRDLSEITLKIRELHGKGMNAWEIFEAIRSHEMTNHLTDKQLQSKINNVAFMMRKAQRSQQRSKQFEAPVKPIVQSTKLNDDIFINVERVKKLRDEIGAETLKRIICLLDTLGK